MILHECLKQNFVAKLFNFVKSGVSELFFHSGKQRMGKTLTCFIIFLDLPYNDSIILETLKVQL